MSDASLPDRRHLPSDIAWMQRAIERARAAALLEEVPVGAVVVLGDRIIAESGNRTRSWKDPTAHAEMVALRAAAARVGDWRILDATLYVTLEPCAMCAGAIVLARVPRLVYAAADPRAGMCGSLGNLVEDPRLNHRAEVCGGVLEEASASLLRSFFRARRRQDEGAEESDRPAESAEPAGRQGLRGR